jgi:hypothetical protein
LRRSRLACTSSCALMSLESDIELMTDWLVM